MFHATIDRLTRYTLGKFPTLRITLYPHTIWGREIELIT